MNQDLVTLTTQDLSNAIPVTNSLKVAEKFKKRHDIVLRDIRTLEVELRNSLTKEEFNLYKFEEIERVDSKGRIQPYYKMNRDFFLMLVMGYRTKEAYKIKHEFIQAFNFLEKELLTRIETRAITKIKRKELTDTIKNCIDDEGNFKKFAFSNYTRLIYKKVLGKEIKKIKEERNIPKDKNIRNYLTIEELEKVQEIESKVAYFIEFTSSEDKKEVYKKVKKYLEGQD